MRTNIVLNDELLQEAARYAQRSTKKGVIEEALKTFIRVKAEERQKITYEQRLEKLQHKLAGLTLRESPLQLLRKDRDTR